YLDCASTERGTINENVINITSTAAIYGARMYYGRYFSFEKNKITVQNTTTIYPLYCYNYYDANYTYNTEVYINDNEINSKSTTTTYVYGHQDYSKNCRFNGNKITVECG